MSSPIAENTTDDLTDVAIAIGAFLLMQSTEAAGPFGRVIYKEIFEGEIRDFITGEE